MPFKITLSFYLVTASFYPQHAAEKLSLWQVFNLLSQKSEKLQKESLKLAGNELRQEAVRKDGQGKLSLISDLKHMETWIRDSSTNAEGEWQVALQWAQPLYEGAGRSENLKHLGAMQSAIASNQKAEEEKLFIELSNHYYRILALEKEISTIDEGLKVYTDRIQWLKNRVAIGRSRQAEVLASESQKAVLEAQKAALHASLSEYFARLQSWIGLETQFKLQETKIRTFAHQEVPKQNPEISRFEWELKAAEANIAIEKAKDDPQLNLILEHRIKYPFLDANYSQRMSAGLAFNWLLYDAGTQSARISESIQAKKIAQLHLEESQRVHNEDLLVLTKQLGYIEKQQLLYQSAYEQAEKNVKLQKQEYETGLISHIEYSQALDLMISTKRNKDNVYYKLQELTLVLALKRLGLEQLLATHGRNIE